MGIYNCASTLQDSLNCLYRQTYHDFEIILCDDGSTDDTYKVALDNAKLHKNIVLIKNSFNQGLNVTLNNCLTVAKGEYIARMDGDDLCDPTRFEKELMFLESHPEYAFVSTPMFFFDEKGVFGKSTGGKEPSKYDFLGQNPFFHAPCMVRKSAYDAVGGYAVDDKLLRVEDYHLWMKMYEQGLRGYVMDECLYSMRDDRNATLRRKPFKYTRNDIYACYLACSHLKMPFWSYIYCLKPLIVFLMPIKVYEFIHKKKLNNN